MRYQPLPATFHAANRRRLAEALDADAIAVIDTADQHARGDADYPYWPDPNFYYLTGIDEPQAVLILVPGHGEAAYREFLFVTGTSEFMAAWEGDRLTAEQATAISGIDQVLPITELNDILGRLSARYRTIYLAAADTLDSAANSPALRRARHLRDKLPLHQFKSALPILNRLRQVKDPVEVAQIRAAITVTEAGMRAAWKALKPGVGEYELVAELTAQFLRAKSRYGFEPIVASGAGATIVHYMANTANAQKDDLVLFDISAEVGFYAADISRTVPVSGRFTDRQRAIYAVVLAAQDEGLKMTKPGQSVLSIDRRMQEVLLDGLASLGVLTAAQVKGKDKIQHLRDYYAHISHHLGLDVHDTGGPHVLLEPGMVITCEPGLYLKEEGVGVRIEDDLLITADGYELLSGGLPRDPDKIEADLGNQS